METLIEKNNVKNRWYPQPVSKYKNAIRIPNDSDQNRRLNSNFSYSMQYIEFLEKQINELKLSEVLLTMLYKSYIITGMSIIELLFVYLLQSKKQWNMTEWELVSCIPANPKQIVDETIKIETSIFKKIPEVEMRMDLDSMIKRIEKKNLLTINHDVFPALKKLRELRNRVHLQSGNEATDHDYNNFGFEEIQMMRRILYAILTCPEFCSNANVFEFINTIYAQGL